MTSLLQYLLIIVAVNVGVTFAVYVRKDSQWLIYFSETEIAVNVREYRYACQRIGGSPKYIWSQRENEFIFASYSGSEAYMINYLGPLADGEFREFSGHKLLQYNNFENETAARSGDFGIAYFDFPNNWWKVAPLMGQRKMRYICHLGNPCYFDPCVESDRAQCVVNSTSGWRHCEYNVTSCNDGAVCRNFGTCVDEADGYRCQCLGIYSGKHCEVRDKCWSNPWRHLRKH